MPHIRLNTPKNKSIEMPLNIKDSTPTGSIFSHSNCEIVTPITDDGYLKPMVQPLNIQNSTPTGSIFSHSYCEIVTPITDNRLIFTIESSPKLPIQPIRGRHSHNKRGKITYIASSDERKPKTGLFSRAKKEKSAKTSLTQTSQAEEQRRDEKKSSQVSQFKRSKLGSSLSKLKSQIMQKNPSTENHETSPCISPIKTRQNLRTESFFQFSDKSSRGKGFFSKCRNRLQILTMKAY